QFQVSEGEYVECHKDELGLRTDLLFAQERLENLIRKRDEISEEIKEKQALLLWLEKKSMVDKKQLDEIRDNIHKLEKNERDLLKKIEKKEEEIRELEEKLPPGSQASIGEEPRETDLLNPLAPAPSPALIDRHKDGIAAIIEAAGGSMDRSALATLSARYGIEGSALDLLISELDGKNGLSITAPASRNEPAGCSFAYGIDPYPPGGGLQLCLSPVFEKCSEVLETETPKPETAPSPVPKPLLAHQITGIS
nr:hypothetical protein [Alphaproteobacteria bacterium]